MLTLLLLLLPLLLLLLPLLLLPPLLLLLPLLLVTGDMHSPKLALSRSWDGVVREQRTEVTGSKVNKYTTITTDNSNNNDNLNDYTYTSSRSGGGGGWSGGGSSGSVSESSGSIVNQRMFERSAPAAPGCGLDRAWIARQSHQDLLFGKEDEEGRAGYNGPGGRRKPRRRGHKEAEQMRLLDNIARGLYEVCQDFVGDDGADFISQVGGG